MINEELKNKIEGLIKSNKVFLFMKGTPQNPKCGFSMKVCEELRKNNIEFDSCDVLSDEEIRQGIKEYSDWPTIPQLYINGNFVGGADIVVQMSDSDDLKELVS